MDKLHNRSNFHNPKRFFMIMQLHLQWVFTIGKKGFSLPTILDCTRFKGRKFRGRFWDYQDSIFKVLNIKEGHKSLIRMLIIISQPTRSLQFVSRPNKVWWLCLTSISKKSAIDFEQLSSTTSLQYC